MKKATLRLSAVLVMALLLGLPATTVAQRGPDASGFRALSGQKAAAFSVPGDTQLVKTFYLSRYFLTYERYQQVFGAGGAEVFGGQITLYRDNGGNITTVIGAHYPNIVPTSAVGLTQASARRVVDRDLGPGGQRKVDLLINPTTGRYFYRVETRSFATRWFHWIDAANGQILKKYDGITNDDATGVNGGTKSVNLLTTFHGDAGHGASGAHWDLFSNVEDGDIRQKTYDYRNRDPYIYFVTDADNHWNLVKNNRRSPGQPALFDAQYYANVTDDYLMDNHSFDWIGCYPAGIESVAHNKRNYNNAHWTGAFLLYGDGDGTLFRQLSGGLDVVAHEATHGVSDCTSGLIYLNESGALNESFSDVLATSAEFYADANGLDPTVGPDWQLGEDVYLPADSAPGFRNMADPEEDGDPDHYSERQVGGGDNGGVHTNSGIPNHAYYLLVNGGLNGVSKLNASCASPGDHNSAHCTGAGTTEVTAIDLEDAEQIFFLAFTALSENATMADARAATEAVATPLGSQQLDSTTAAWVAVGVGPTSPVTDIAITSVSAPSSVVQGDEVSVNVTVENVGNQDVGSDITVSLTESDLSGDFRTS